MKENDLHRLELVHVVANIQLAIAETSQAIRSAVIALLYSSQGDDAASKASIDEMSSSLESAAETMENVKAFLASRLSDEGREIYEQIQRGD